MLAALEALWPEPDGPDDAEAAEAEFTVGILANAKHNTKIWCRE